MKKYFNRFCIGLLLMSALSMQSCYFDFDDDGGRGDFEFNRCEEGFGSTTTEELFLDDFTGIKLSTDAQVYFCLLYTSPSPRDATLSRMPSSA